MTVSVINSSLVTANGEQCIEGNLIPQSVQNSLDAKVSLISTQLSASENIEDFTISKLEYKLKQLDTKSNKMTFFTVASLSCAIAGACLPKPFVAFRTAMIVGGSILGIGCGVKLNFMLDKRDRLKLKLEANKSYAQTYKQQLADVEKRTAYVKNYIKQKKEEMWLASQRAQQDSSFDCGGYVDTDTNFVCTTDCSNGDCITTCCDADGHCIST